LGGDDARLQDTLAPTRTTAKRPEGPTGRRCLPVTCPNALAQRGGWPSAVSGGVVPMRWWSGRACQGTRLAVTGSIASQA
jgi:hypothetical protein